MKLKKGKVDQKLLMTLAGVAVVAGSVVAVADYVKRKKEARVAHAAELIFGIAGVAAGTLLATEPRRKTNRIALELEDIFEDEDIELARRQIRETLNGVTEEETTPVEAPLVTEDADEEAALIAADFIE